MLQIVLRSTSVKTVADGSLQPVRQISRARRRLLASIPLLELVVELAVLFLGVTFLCTSSSVGEVIASSALISHSPRCRLGTTPLPRHYLSTTLATCSTLNRHATIQALFKPPLTRPQFAPQVILNAVAINFISEIDEVALTLP